MNPILRTLLEAREIRYQHQRELLAAHGSTLISFTLNVPGAAKQSERLQQVHTWGMSLLCGLFSPADILYCEARHPATGSEGFLCVRPDAGFVKTQTVSLEEQLAIGRLFDIDVFAPSGNPVSRTELNLPLRKCYLCGAPAKVCAIRQAHPMSELLQAVEDMIEQWGREEAQ